MSSKKVILRRDQFKIDSAARDLRDNLKEAQEYITWFSSVEFCPELKGIDEIKEFLDNPHATYERAVRKQLAALTGLKTLPNNIDNLVAMYEIPECQAWSVSDKFGFDYLQIDEKGNLFYSQEIYDKIEAENVLYATPEQADALNELERLWNDLQTINEVINPVPGISRQLFERDLAQLLDKLIYYKPLMSRDVGMNMRWTLQALEALSVVGFGSQKKKESLTSKS